MRIDNIKGNEVAAQAEHVRKAGTQAVTGRTSITRGALRIASPEGLIVEGTAKVSGTLTVTGPDGKLIGSGTLEWTGPANLNGPTTITDTLDVSGLVSLLSDLLVKAGAQITVEGSIPMQVGAEALGIPGVSFAGGGGLVGNGSGAAMFGGAGVGSGAAVVATSSTASIGMGSKSVSVNGTRTTIDGGVDLPRLAATPSSGKTPNVWIDPSTKILYQLT